MAIEFPITNAGLKYVARANKIVINNPVNITEAYVSFSNDKFILDENNNVIGTSPLSSTNRRVLDVVTEEVTFLDKVKGQENTISIAGLEAAIEAFYIKWLTEDLQQNEQNQ